MAFQSELLKFMSTSIALNTSLFFIISMPGRGDNGQEYALSRHPCLTWESLTNGIYLDFESLSELQRKIPHEDSSRPVFSKKSFSARIISATQIICFCEI